MAGLIPALIGDITNAANCMPTFGAVQSPNFNGLMMPTSNPQAASVSAPQRNNTSNSCLAGQQLPGFYQKAYSDTYGANTGLAANPSTQQQNTGPSSTPSVGNAPNVTFNIPTVQQNGSNQASCVGAQLAAKVPALAINQGVKALSGMYKGSVGNSLSQLLGSGNATNSVTPSASSLITQLGSGPSTTTANDLASAANCVTGGIGSLTTCLADNALTGTAGNIAGCVALDAVNCIGTNLASCAATTAAGSIGCAVPGVGTAFSSIMDFVNGKVGAGLGELGGAAIGTAIFPGIGTAVGGLLGGVLGGSSVICTELYYTGNLSYDVYMADDAFGRTLSRNAILGYHTWARPFTKLMRTSKIANYIGRTIGIAWANEMAFKQGVRTAKSNLLGRFLLLVGVPICGFIGKLRAR